MTSDGLKSLTPPECAGRTRNAQREIGTRHPNSEALTVLSHLNPHALLLPAKAKTDLRDHTVKANSGYCSSHGSAARYRAIVDVVISRNVLFGIRDLVRSSSRYAQHRNSYQCIIPEDTGYQISWTQLVWSRIQAMMVVQVQGKEGNVRQPWLMRFWIAGRGLPVNRMPPTRAHFLPASSTSGVEHIGSGCASIPDG